MSFRGTEENTLMITNDDFFYRRSRLNTMMDQIPKSKKNKRCILHSLDTHKVKTLA